MRGADTIDWMRTIAVILSAAALALVGLWLGFQAKRTVKGMFISGIAGALGGGLAAYAALGVIERARANER